MKSFSINSLVRLSAEFRNLAGDLADPTTITIKVKSEFDSSSATHSYPSGDIVKDAVGQYHVDHLVDKPGVWNYFVQGTGAVVVTEGESFYVEAANA
jgi:hypothetical protein